MALATRFSSWIHQTLLQQVNIRIRSLREALVGPQAVIHERLLWGILYRGYSAFTQQL